MQLSLMQDKDYNRGNDDFEKVPNATLFMAADARPLFVDTGIQSCTGSGNGMRGHAP